MYSMVNTLFDFFFCKHRTAYEMRISDWSSDVCSSDLNALVIGCPVRTAGEQIFSDGLGIEFRYGRQHGPGRGGVTRRIDGFVRNTSQRRREAQPAPFSLDPASRKIETVDIRHAAGAMHRDRKSTRLNSSH